MDEERGAVTELAWRRAGPALAGAVLAYTGYAQRGGAPVRFRELPCAHVPFVVDLGPGWTIADPRRPSAAPARVVSFAAGLTDGPVVVGHAGRAECLQIDLAPLGARRLLGVPMAELAHRTVPLEDLLGPGAGRLAEALADAPDWEARFALVEGVLAARLAEAPPARPETAWALGRIGASGGAIPVGSLARELGWSHRRLIARFRDEVGVPPKTVARIVRFERLLAALGTAGDRGWARLAAACGYADQAHLAREVRELAGVTPTALRAERVNSVQERAAAPA